MAQEDSAPPALAIDELLKTASSSFAEQLDRLSETKIRAKRMQVACKEAESLEQRKLAELRKKAQDEAFTQTREVMEDKKTKKGKKGVETAGPGWFDLPATPLTPEVKRDLQILNLRNYIDRTQHYKRATEKPKKLPKFFQIGTLVGEAKDYYSMGSTRTMRNKSLADQLLESSELRKYRKKKFLEVQEKSAAGGKLAYKKRIEKRKPQWSRSS